MTTVLPVTTTVAATARSPLKDLGRGFLRSPASLAALAFLLLLVFLSVAAPLVMPYDPAAQSLGQKFLGPSASHLLGTDQFGRDVLSELVTR